MESLKSGLNTQSGFVEAAKALERRVANTDEGRNGDSQRLANVKECAWMWCCIRLAQVPPGRTEAGV